ncbi:hypothetical protein T484DRAFT_2140187 [Baffinella frigidus]|nr:hypothetical protein T484DRAFT_2140187 [Cryptophyta sp. CCMP2293]
MSFREPVRRSGSGHSMNITTKAMLARRQFPDTHDQDQDQGSWSEQLDGRGPPRDQLRSGSRIPATEEHLSSSRRRPESTSMHQSAEAAERSHDLQNDHRPATAPDWGGDASWPAGRSSGGVGGGARWGGDGGFRVGTPGSSVRAGTPDDYGGSRPGSRMSPRSMIFINNETPPSTMGRKRSGRTGGKGRLASSILSVPPANETAAFETNSIGLSLPMPHTGPRPSMGTIDQLASRGVGSLNSLPSNMSADEAKAWMGRWTGGFARESSEFRSAHNYAATKLAEVNAAEGSREDQGDDARPGEGHGIEVFRAAVSLALLGRLACGSEVGAFSDVLKRIRDDLAAAIYQDVVPSDLAGESSGFEFTRTPHLLASSRLSSTAAVVHSRAQALEARMEVMLKEKARMEEDLKTADARIDGFRLRVMTLERQLQMFEDEMTRRETQMLNQVQQMRERALQGALAQEKAMTGGDVRSIPAHSGEPGASGDDAGVAFTEEELARIAEHRPENVIKTTLNLATTACELLDEALAMTDQACLGTEAVVSDDNDPRLLLECLEKVEPESPSSSSAITLSTKDGDKKADPYGFNSEAMIDASALEVIRLWVIFLLREADSAGKAVDIPKTLEDECVTNGKALLHILNRVLPEQHRMSDIEFDRALEMDAPHRIHAAQALVMSNGSIAENLIGVSVPDTLMALFLSFPGLHGRQLPMTRVLFESKRKVEEQVKMVKHEMAALVAHSEQVQSVDGMIDETYVDLLCKEVRRGKITVAEASRATSNALSEHRECGKVWVAMRSKVRMYLINSLGGGGRREEPEKKDDNFEDEKSGEDQSEVQQAVISAIKRSKGAGSDAARDQLPQTVRKMVSNLLPAKLGDVLASVSSQHAVIYLEAAAEAVLFKFDVLRKVFRHYCKTHRAVGAAHDAAVAIMGGAGLSLQGWQNLLDDARLLGIATTRQLHPKEAENIFKLANMTMDPTTGNYVFGLGASELETHEFVEALFRVSLIISEQVRQDPAQVFGDVIHTISARCDPPLLPSRGSGQSVLALWLCSGHPHHLCQVLSLALLVRFSPPALLRLWSVSQFWPC